MSPFSRLKETLAKSESSSCEADSTAKKFVQEYKEKTEEAIQQLNKEHSRELEKHQQSSE